MSVFSQPTSYSEMLTKIAIFTFGTTWLLTILLGAQSPTIAATLNALDVEVKVWVFEKVKLGWILPAAIVAFFSRVLKLHDRISDIFRIREDFDVPEILVPLAGGVDIPVDVERLSNMRKRRDEVMLQVFYKYASSLKPEIDGQLVRTALDIWTWFWILLESITVAFLAFVVLVFVRAYAAASMLGLGVVAGILLFRQVRPWCRPIAHAEVKAILALPNASAEIKDNLFKLT